MYVAQGRGPHPTAILLHGAAGYEKNLDLAQAIRRAGWNALFFHYRGYWGSGGASSLPNAIEDVRVVLRYLLHPDNSQALRLDPKRLALIGHSLGGWLALRVGVEFEEVKKIGYLAGVNLGNLEGDGSNVASEAADLLMAPVAGQGWPELVDEALRDPDSHDLRNLVPHLMEKSILLVASSRDTALPAHAHHTPLVDMFSELGHRELTAVTLEGDHDFSSVRIALTETVVCWLRNGGEG
jgi:pimeloyl-ACP methyl ester carboxylesterase